MNRSSRFGIISTLFVILSGVCLGGCASPERGQRKVLLALAYNEFDQTYGSGFRLLYDRGEYFKGAVLIEDYLRLIESDSRPAKVSASPCGAAVRFGK